MRRTLLITTAIGAMIAAGSAVAQTTPAQQTTAGPPAASADQAADAAAAAASGPTQTGQTAEAGSTGLREIVVTAQRRSENLQKAAVAVDVVSPAELVRSGLNNSTQLGQLVPALSVQANGGANTIFFLRGVGNFTINGYSDPAIAFNYDGVYVGRPTATSTYFFDLERIEVLKGPQGTIYGRNATAGAINVIPARPVPGELSGFASASYGNYNAYDVQSALNLPLGPDGAIRIAGSAHAHDGYLSDGSSDDKGQALRVQMLARLTPELTVRLGGDYSHVGGVGTGASYASLLVLNPATGHYDSVPSGLEKSIGLLDPRSQAFRTTKLYSGVTGRFQDPLFANAPLYLKNDFYGANAEINWRTDAGTLTVIPAFRATKLNNTYDATGSNQYVQENDAQYSVEARFAGKVSMFDYIVGGYFFDEKVNGNYTFDQQVFSAFQDFISKTRSYAAFTRVTANVTDRLRLVGGVRYTKDRKRFDGETDVVTVICRNPPTRIPACPNATLVPLTDTLAQLPFAVPARGAPPIPQGTSGAIVARGPILVHQPLSGSKVTYRGAVEFDVGPRSLLYASFETGYRSGGFSLAAGHETFAPEFIDAYTIGSKNRFFDNRLQLNIEAFLWKYRNQQVSHSGLDINGVNGVFTDNAGKSTNKGVEVEAQLLATRNTLLNVDVQYLDANFDSFLFVLPRGATPPVTGCPFSPNPANAAQYIINCSGRPGYNSPKLTLNVGGQQTFPLGAYKVVASADTQYKSSRWAGFDFLSFQNVPSNWTSNANLSFGPSDDRWSISGFVRNIENKRIISSPYVLTTGLAGVLITTAPRTYGVRAAAKF